MKSVVFLALAASVLGVAPVVAQTVTTTYTNFIYQIQNGISYQMPNLPPEGNSLSLLGIAAGGAKFELWTVKQEPGQAAVSYLLDHKFVGAYVPAAKVEILSQDPYSTIPRTRADRPFVVKVTVNGLLAGDDPNATSASQSVNLERYVQSYGAKGDGTDIDRTQATLLSQVSIDGNGERTLLFSVTAVPGGNRAKVRGEERFTVMSLPDYQTPASQLATKFIQIWPVADGSLVGLEDGQMVRFAMPPFEVHLNDLYPDSETWAQVYPGEARLGVEGTVIPGSAVVVKTSVPQDRVLRIKDWDRVVGEDGRYTVEILTRTPFGLERLDHVTFDVNRTLKVNGNVTTIE
jgi:hypothetical protein